MERRPRITRGRTERDFPPSAPSRGRGGGAGKGRRKNRSISQHGGGFCRDFEAFQNFFGVSRKFPDKNVKIAKNNGLLY